jgi:DNA repair exonuclease SbcCD nuclease subunit
LSVALKGEIDLVVHGGDLFYRSRIPDSLVEEAFGPLLEVAEKGIPVYIVPGNHERGVIPRTLFTDHDHIFCFDRPRTFVYRKPASGPVSARPSVVVSLSGFPYVREGVRRRFTELVRETGWRKSGADIRLLCLHQVFEGARVGPRDYTFRAGPDVADPGAVPHGIDLVLAGHVHRHQSIKASHGSKRDSIEIVYAGSLERTSFAEERESKGYVVLEAGAVDAGRRLGWRFVELPTRPMKTVFLPAMELRAGNLEAAAGRLLSGLPPDSVVRIKILGPVGKTELPGLSLAGIRRLAPSTMNVELSFAAMRKSGSQRPNRRRP